jgi:hypothetical protein
MSIPPTDSDPPTGPRFLTEDAESKDTLTFWKRVLTARHPQAGARSEVTVHGAD